MEVLCFIIIIIIIIIIFVFFFFFSIVQCQLRTLGIIPKTSIFLGAPASAAARPSGRPADQLLFF